MSKKKSITQEIRDLVLFVYTRSSNDVEKFLREGKKKDLNQLRATLFDRVMTTAKDVGLLYIAPGEVCGCEDVKYNYWPAVWKIGELLEKSCGNADQSQCDAGNLLGTDVLGPWHVIERRPLTEEENANKKWRFVVSKA